MEERGKESRVQSTSVHPPQHQRTNQCRHVLPPPAPFVTHSHAFIHTLTTSTIASTTPKSTHHTYSSLCSVLLRFSASAIAAAPSAPILLSLRLCTPQRQEHHHQQRHTQGIVGSVSQCVRMYARVWGEKECVRGREKPQMLTTTRRVAVWCIATMQQKQQQ